MSTLKTWLITGASSGLGYAMTEALVAAGQRVVATVRRPEALDALCAHYPALLFVKTMDLTDRVSIRAAVDGAFGELGHIDVVISNAGYGLVGGAEEVTDEQIDLQIATNLTGCIHLIRAVLPHLRAQKGGRVVQVSSEGGQTTYPAFSLYHATKWGIEGFVETVAKEVKDFGIDFILVEPGPTKTRFGEGIVMAEENPAYIDTPVGDVRRAVKARAFKNFADAKLSAGAIIAAAEHPHPPLRLPLGSTAYENLTRDLAKRLAEIEGQRDNAHSVQPKSASV